MLLASERVQLNPQADSLLFAAVLLLQPVQIEEVDPVFQIGGLIPVTQGISIQHNLYTSHKQDHQKNKKDSI